jgi:ATP-dependent helicase HrpA
LHEIKDSASKRAQRIKRRPTTNYPLFLPILEKKDQIISAIQKNPVIIISGETGSGKTTQIPKFCLDAGRGIAGKIGCTQPRRIAAVAVAERIAEELGETPGNHVGYKIRFKDKTPKDAYIKIMTDGILLAETQNDPMLYAYDTIIVDEAHERSLNIDFVLGILKNLVKKRKDFKLIITSATIDTEKFSKAFDHAPVIEVSGRMYPVKVKYMAPENTRENESETDAGASYVEKAAEAVDYLQKIHPYGDILIFMPTEQDIWETKELIEGKKYPRITVMPLFARLSGKDQSQIFKKIEDRKIIVATNIAETSLTIPGIKYVVDTGLARIPRYSPRTRTTSLLVSPVSRSSADQRKGRCGRIENGICIRLFSEKDYESRVLYTPPEILRANLAEVILNMMALNLKDIEAFPFIDPPASKSIRDGFDLLVELGAVEKNQGQGRSKQRPGFSLTSKGRAMSRIPMDPRLSCMLIEAQKQGCIKEMLVIASALSIMDPRERPADNAPAADEAHAAFKDPSSDFLTLQNIWTQYHDAFGQTKSNSAMRRFCKDHFLSFRRMREWADVHAQLDGILDDAEFKSKNEEPEKGVDPKSPADPRYASIHRSILCGFLSNIALKKENHIYRAAKGIEVMIFPGSALFGKNKPWIVAAEIMETSRVYARTVAAIDDRWLESAGKNLCRYRYTHPHWDRSRGEVTALEQVSLFGLPIVVDRTVSFGRINPDEASKIFIQNALVEEEINTPFAFLQHNRKLINEVKKIEHKVRKRDILIDDSDIFSFYAERLSGCCDVRTLAFLLKNKKDDAFLRMKLEDLFRQHPDPEEISLYPDFVKLGKRTFECTYRFLPGDNKDGLTVKVPLTLATEIPANELDWLVPGLYKEKINGLIKGLPKAYRKRLVPIKDTVDIICNEMPAGKGALFTLLSRFILRRFGVDIPASAWTDDLLPNHLKARILITGKNGEEISSGRDKTILTQSPAVASNAGPGMALRKKWEKTGLTQWDFPDLPDSVTVEDKAGNVWILYPGLALAGSDPKKDGLLHVDVILFSNRTLALASHKKGVAALYVNHFSKDLRFLKKNLMLPDYLKDPAKSFGGKKTIENKLFDQAVDDLFHKNIRSREDFIFHAKSVEPTLMQAGLALLNRFIPILCARYETDAALAQLRKENQLNPAAVQRIEELAAAAGKLVPADFISLYDAGRLPHIQRYLKAMIIRARRALVNLDKDNAKAVGVRAYDEKLDHFLKTLTLETSDEKKDAVADLFWMIEEFKVSVFAQELKTAVKVSSKKLEEKIKEIERMV